MTTKFHVIRSLEEARRDINYLLRNTNLIEDVPKHWVPELSKTINRLQHLRSFVKQRSDAYPDPAPFQDADGIEIEQAFDEF